MKGFEVGKQERCFTLLRLTPVPSGCWPSGSNTPLVCTEWHVWVQSRTSPSVPWSFIVPTTPPDVPEGDPWW